MANEIQTKQNQAVATKGEESLKTAAAKLTNLYMTEVTTLNAVVGVPVDDEAKRCATNALVQLCADIGAEGVQNLPKNQLIKVLQFVTINHLDVFSGQVFLDKRKDKTGNYVSINATPMGNAYEIMTARFGVNVKTVHPARIVHEGDELELPQYEGLNATPIKHKTTLKGLDGKAIAVYYIIEKTDGTFEYAISTREQVASNLKAHILNNALRDANFKREELMKRLEDKKLDDILRDDQLSTLISPSYRSPATREQMIITKMKKNALLHYTRDLGSKSVGAMAIDSEVDKDNDMVVSVQSEESKPSEPVAKVADFDVDDNGEVVEAEVKKTPADKQEQDEQKLPNSEDREDRNIENPRSAKGNEDLPANKKAKEEDSEQGSLFDTEDL